MDVIFRRILLRQHTAALKRKSQQIQQQLVRKHVSEKKIS